MQVKRHEITDSQWLIVEPLLPKRNGRPGGNVRVFVNAVLWIAKTGSPWRDLPERFGKWNDIYQRYAYWCHKNYFKAIFDALIQPDLEEVMIDSTVVKCHQSSAGAAAKKKVLNQLADLWED